MTTQIEADAALRTVRIIRLAWFDEKLDAEARGDAAAAAQANLNLSACELQIRRLERQLKPPPAHRRIGFLAAGRA
jgi:hypothetical protein